MNKAIGSILPLIGRIFTPAAMVVFLTYEISRSQQVDGWWQTAVVIGAAATAVGVEVVGILSGHALEGFWRTGDKARATAAFVLLLIYTAAGVVILRHNPTLVPIPIVAAVVYLVAALVDGLEAAVSRQTDDEQARQTWEREQEAADRELARELKRQAQADKTAVSLAQIEARTAALSRQDAGEMGGEFQGESGILPADWRQLTRQQRRDLAHLPREEREAIMPPLAARTRRDWHTRLDEIASQNGEYKA
ncbi:MAG: hypothetical protein H6661_14565 [Ardenticatenaceae bacterium]|nr:hypothetical protein [Ardenticatenaceae bacterium]